MLAIAVALQSLFALAALITVVFAAFSWQAAEVERKRERLEKRERERERRWLMRSIVRLMEAHEMGTTMM